MNEELKPLYEHILGLDANFKNHHTEASFAERLKDANYQTQLHSWLTSMGDEQYGKMSAEEFSSFVKKNSSSTSPTGSNPTGSSSPSTGKDPGSSPSAAKPGGGASAKALNGEPLPTSKHPQLQMDISWEVDQSFARDIAGSFEDPNEDPNANFDYNLGQFVDAAKKGNDNAAESYYRELPFQEMSPKVQEILGVKPGEYPKELTSTQLKKLREYRDQTNDSDKSARYAVAYALQNGRQEYTKALRFVDVTQKRMEENQRQLQTMEKQGQDLVKKLEQAKKDNNTAAYNNLAGQINSLNKEMQRINDLNADMYDSALRISADLTDMKWMGQAMGELDWKARGNFESFTVGVWNELANITKYLGAAVNTIGNEAAKTFFATPGLGSNPYMSNQIDAMTGSMYDRMRQASENAQFTVDPNDETINTVATGVGQMGSQIVLAITTGTAANVTFGMGMVSEEVLQSARDAGIEESDARKLAGLVGVLGGGFEAFVPEVIANKYTKGAFAKWAIKEFVDKGYDITKLTTRAGYKSIAGQMLKNYVLEMGGEISTEVIQGVISDTGQRIYNNMYAGDGPKFDVVDSYQELKERLVETVKTTALQASIPILAGTMGSHRNIPSARFLHDYVKQNEGVLREAVAKLGSNWRRPLSDVEQAAANRFIDAVKAIPEGNFSDNQTKDLMELGIALREENEKLQGDENEYSQFHQQRASAIGNAINEVTQGKQMPRDAEGRLDLDGYMKNGALEVTNSNPQATPLERAMQGVQEIWDAVAQSEQERLAPLANSAIDYDPKADVTEARTTEQAVYEGSATVIDNWGKVPVNIAGKTVATALTKVGKAFGSFVPDVRVVLHSSQDTYETLTGVKDALGMYNPETKTIHLPPSNVKANTAIHEVMHPVMAQMVRSYANNATWAKAGEQLASLRPPTSLKGKENGYLEWAKRVYKGQPDWVIQNEALVEFLADTMAADLNSNPSLFNKIKEQIYDLLEAMGIDARGAQIIESPEDLQAFTNSMVKAVRGNKKAVVRDMKKAGLSQVMSERVADQLTRWRLNDGANPFVDETSPLYPAMTEDEDGNFVFFHYSNEARKSIKPWANFGGNRITGRDERSGYIGTASSFYYTSPKIQEPGTGPVGHAVKVPKNKVYDGLRDPLDLAGRGMEIFKERYPNRAPMSNTGVAYMAEAAREAGFDMIVTGWDVEAMDRANTNERGFNRAQTVNELTPVEIFDGERRPSDKYQDNISKGWRLKSFFWKRDKRESAARLLSRWAEYEGGGYDNVLYGLDRHIMSAEDPAFGFASDMNPFDSWDDVVQAVMSSEAPENLKQDFISNLGDGFVAEIVNPNNDGGNLPVGAQPRYRLMGEIGSDYAASAMDNLINAMELSYSNQSTGRISTLTGWTPVGGEWSFRPVPDKVMFKIPGEQFTIGEALNFEALYNIQPSVRNAPVVFLSMSEMNGYSSFNEAGTIYLSERLIEKPDLLTAAAVQEARNLALAAEGRGLENLINTTPFENYKEAVRSAYQGSIDELADQLNTIPEGSAQANRIEEQRQALIDRMNHLIDVESRMRVYQGKSTSSYSPGRVSKGLVSADTNFRKAVLDEATEADSAAIDNALEIDSPEKTLMRYRLNEPLSFESLSEMGTADAMRSFLGISDDKIAAMVSQGTQISYGSKGSKMNTQKYANALFSAMKKVPKRDQVAVLDALKTIREYNSGHPEALPKLPALTDSKKIKYDVNKGRTSANIKTGQMAHGLLDSQKTSGITRDQWTEMMSDEMVFEFKQYEDRPDIMAAKTWYSDTKERIERIFGASMFTFAQLFGATSARTDVASNFRQTAEAMELFSTGAYNEMLQLFDQYVQDSLSEMESYREEAISNVEKAYQEAMATADSTRKINRARRDLEMNLRLIKEEGRHLKISFADGTSIAATNFQDQYRVKVNSFRSQKEQELKSIYQDQAPTTSKQIAQDLRAMGVEKVDNKIIEKNSLETLKKAWVEAKVMQDLANKYLPVRKNGKKYNANSDKVLHAIAGLYYEQTVGPKTKQFAQNLAGISHAATIDIWAMRTLRRLANQGKAVWRIPPAAESGVTDQDFTLGQEVFQKAADKLGMFPDDLQALMWFLEKDVYEQNGWTNEVGARKSSFESELQAIEEEGYDRLQFGVTTDTFAEMPEEGPARMKEAIDSIEKELSQTSGVMGARVNQTIGQYMDYVENAIDFEVTLKPNTDINPLVRKVIGIGEKNFQYDVFVSKMVNEDHPNARPYTELLFAQEFEPGDPLLQQLIAELEGDGDARFGFGYTWSRNRQGKVIGFRTQYVPEFSGALDAKKAQAEAEDFKERFSNLQSVVKERFPWVSGYTQGHVSTIVIGFESYGTAKEQPVTFNTSLNERLSERARTTAQGDRDGVWTSWVTTGVIPEGSTNPEGDGGGPGGGSNVDAQAADGVQNPGDGNGNPTSSSSDGEVSARGLRENSREGNPNAGEGQDGVQTNVRYRLSESEAAEFLNSQPEGESQPLYKRVGVLEASKLLAKEFNISTIEAGMLVQNFMGKTIDEKLKQRQISSRPLNEISIEVESQMKDNARRYQPVKMSDQQRKAWDFIEERGIMKSFEYVNDNIINEVTDAFTVLLAEELNRITNRELRSGNLSDTDRQTLISLQSQTAQSFFNYRTRIGQAMAAMRYYGTMHPSALADVLVGDIFTLMEESGQQMTNEMEQQIRDMVNALDTIEPGKVRERAIIKILQNVQSIIGFPTGSLLENIWYANILSGFTTQQLNILSNFWKMVTEVPVTLLTNITKRILAGENPLSGVVTAGYAMFGMVYATKAAFYSAANSMFNGGLRNQSKIDIGSSRSLETAVYGRLSSKKSILGKVGILAHNALVSYGKVARYVFRMLSAMDAGFKEINRGARVFELAHRRSVDNGKWFPSSDELLESVSDLTGVTADEMRAEALNIARREVAAYENQFGQLNFMRREALTLARQSEVLSAALENSIAADAEEFAKRHTFTHEPEGFVGKVAGWIKGLARTPWAIPGTSKQIRPLVPMIPFVDIVANVVNAYIEYTPLGFVAAGNKMHKGEDGKVSEERIRLMTRASMGTALYFSLLAQALGDDDEPFITAGISDDLQIVYQSKAAGIPQYSIKLGDKWYSYRSSPFASVFASLGYISDLKKYDPETWNDQDAVITVLKAGFAAIAPYLFDQSFLTSTRDIMEGVEFSYRDSGLSKIGNWISNSGKAVFMPNLWTQGYRLVRAQRGLGIKGTEDRKTVVGWLQTFYRDIPVANDGLYTMVNVLGEDITANTNPFSIEELPDDDPYKFIWKNRLWIPSNKSIRVADYDLKRDRPMTSKENYLFNRFRGELIRTRIIPEAKAYIEEALNNPDFVKAAIEADPELSKFQAEQIVRMKVKEKWDEIISNSTKLAVKFINYTIARDQLDDMEIFSDVAEEFEKKYLELNQ